MLPLWKRQKLVISVVALLLVCLALELGLAGRRQSQTFDEADHILAGYRYWKCADFAANLEHPPLVKLIASFPLLFQNVSTPNPFLCGSAPASTRADFVEGRAFLYSNNADSLLFQTRLFASLFTIVLGLVLFWSTRATFGVGPGLIALTIFVFEPNLLAHGFLVTTDMGLACCLYAAVYAFYLYLEKGTRGRLLLTGILAGATLAAKHSGLLIFPILAAVTCADLAIEKARPQPTEALSFKRRLLSLAEALALIALIAYVVLWAFYAFRFSARPNAEMMAYPTESGRGVVRWALASLFTGLLRFHLLPEAYLYGIKHVLASVRGGGPIFVLGKMYPSGRWFYFPTVFLVKSTLGFLALLLLAATGLFLARDKNRRALAVLSISPLLFLAFCLPSKLDIGIRHILPVYPFFIVLAAAGTWELRRFYGASYAVAALIVLHAASSVATFPNYISYCNEAFGGTRNAYRVLGESNVDWGQSFKEIERYIRKNNIKDCWISYLTSGNPIYYHTGCKFLPTTWGWVSRDDMSKPEVGGTLLIGASDLEYSAELDPYAQFRKIAPVGSIGGTVLVFRGRFDLPLAFALSRMNMSATLSDEGRYSEAIEVARKAVAVAPDMSLPHGQLARALAGANRIEDARTEYLSAIFLARKFQLEYHPWYLAQYEKELQQLH